MRKEKPGLLALVLMAALCRARAAEEEGDQAYPVVQEGAGITITGTRTEKRLQESPHLTEIITKEEIDASGAASVHEVLAEYGVLFASNGMGDYVALQGLGEGRILYLVNGRRLAGRIAQRLNGETLPLGNIERIEIVRGPQSALYGSEGIGGVINIITKEPEAGFSLTFSLENSLRFAYDDPDRASSPAPFDDFYPFQGQKALVHTNFSLGPVHNTLTLTGNRASFYYNETESRSILPAQYQGSAALETAFSPLPNLGIQAGGSFMGMQSDDQTRPEGDLTRYGHSRLDAHIQVDLSLATDTRFLITLYDSFYQRDKDEYAAEEDRWTAGENHENEHILSLEAQGVWSAVWPWTFLAGLEGTYTGMDKYNFNKDGASAVWVDKEAVFVQAERAGDRYAVIGGLRLERNAQFGFFAAPKVSAMYYLLPGLRVLGSAGLGYRAPAFSDLYQTTDSTRYVIYPNADMRPEYALSVNAGVELAGPGYFAQVNYYYSELFDEIYYFYRDEETGEAVSVANSGQVEVNGEGKPIRYRDNLSRSRRLGFDAEGRLTIAGYFFVGAGESFVFAYNVREAAVLHDTPANTVKFKVGFNNEKGSRNPIYTYLGARFITPLEDGSDADRLQLLLDYFFNIRLGGHWTVHVSLTNLLGGIGYYYSEEGNKWTGHGEKVGQTVKVGVRFEW